MDVVGDSCRSLLPVILTSHPLVSDLHLAIEPHPNRDPTMSHTSSLSTEDGRTWNRSPRHARRSIHATDLTPQQVQDFCEKGKQSLS